MSNQDIKRIADALEEIASLMRGRHAKQPSAIDVQCEEMLALMRENADKLIGKMEMPEIAQALGIHMVPSKRRLMGTALRAYGAVRGISGNRGYYLFPGTEREARSGNANPGREVLRADAFRQALAVSWRRAALRDAMPLKHAISSLGFSQIPGDKVALSSALVAEGIPHTMTNDIIVFD